ncbi:protein CNPPD1 [Cydia amplana]|uniref:protein CNPPD1 n=1 Tax=Cydia amplana TaxID=1869771 RepID=UPI002FE534EA
MSNISKRRREGSRSKIKSMGDHKEFLNRITKTLYYGELPSLPCLSLPVTEVSCALWSAAQQGRSLRRLHGDAAARLAYEARVSPCALVLALLYLERLRHRNPAYVAAAAPADLFLVSLMVGNKFLQDDGEDAETLVTEWAAAGGLTPADLKRLEIDFLNAIEWNVYVNNDSFESGLSWLESQVALKQAKERGFFTYSDLAAAGGGINEHNAGVAVAGAAAAAIALAYVAALSALVTSAFLVSYTLPLLQLTQTTLLSTPQTLEPCLNATVDFTDTPRCCTDWLNYHSTIKTPQVYSVNLQEPWFKIETDFTWYRSSLVDPLQKWLEKLDEYADEYIFKSSKCSGSAMQPRCVRQWLNLSQLGGLVVISDR